VLRVVDARSITGIERAHGLPIGQVSELPPTLDAADAFEKDDLLAVITVETFHVPA
jgi:hypothetical protein